MRGRLTDCRYTIVTRGAVIDDTGVIEHRIQETTGDMTDTAIFSRRQMSCVFAARPDTIVACRAVVHNAGMIKHTGGKCCGVMTYGTIFGGRYMRGRFTRG